MIYTRNGDDGRTCLHGARISKSSLQCETLGSLDELNCLLGLCVIRAQKSGRVIFGEFGKTCGGCSGESASEFFGASRVSEQSGCDKPLADIFREIQNVLFTVQACVAGYHKPPDKLAVVKIENYIAMIEKPVPMPKNFVLAGGSEDAAFYDYVRTVVRRAERVFVSFLESENISPDSCAEQQALYALHASCSSQDRLVEDLRTALIFLNRLSSFMYVCARFENAQAGIPESAPRYTVTE